MRDYTGLNICVCERERERERLEETRSRLQNFEGK